MGNPAAQVLEGHRARQLLQRGALLGPGLPVGHGEPCGLVLPHPGASVVRQVPGTKAGVSVLQSELFCQCALYLHPWLQVGKQGGGEGLLSLHWGLLHAFKIRHIKEGCTQLCMSAHWAAYGQHSVKNSSLPTYMVFHCDTIPSINTMCKKTF